MNRVLIWDYASISSQWMEQVADMSDIEIVGRMTPAESVPKILLENNSWDWLLIFERGIRNFFEATIQVQRLPLDKVIYALDMNSWLKNPKAIFSLLNDSGGGGVVQRWFNFNTCRTLNDFVACTVEGLSYVATSKDITIMSEMYINRVNWAAGEMKIFYELSKQYYNVDDSKGYFLDLGANIGTTGIYFTKKLAPNLKLLSFEPDAENFKLHRINLILNDMESASTLVNFGLGDKFDEVIMYRDLVNPGHNNITEPKENVPTETIKIIPLDSYLYENNISAQEVKYIWIDTEGFEPQVLLGAKNLLRENPAPIFMECNLRAWDNSGYFEDMFMFLSENYSHFALIASGKGTLYSLETLRELERPDNTLGQIGDIFFVRRGAID